MLEKQYIREKMKQRGFTEIAESPNVSITFIYMPETETHSRFPIPVYNCKVTMDGKFQFQYSTPTSINILQSPMCGSFEDDEHFDNICSKFKTEASVLARFCS